MKGFCIFVYINVIKRKSLITDVRVFNSFNKIVYFLILNLTVQNSLNLIFLNVIDF